jgi:integrase
MKTETKARKKPERDRKFIVFEGRRYPLFKEVSGTWRIRSKARSHKFDAGLGTTDYQAARQIAADLLSGRTPHFKKRGAENLEEVAAIYLELPKKASARVASLNVSRLRAICRIVFGKELDAVKLCEVTPKLWRDYFTKRLGGKLDLATRRGGNAAINSAVRMACSIFIDRLRPGYEEHGVILPPDCTRVDWLPVLKGGPKEARGGDLVEEWAKLPIGPEWFAIGLARFAGLRRGEIEACRGSWIVEHKGQPCVQLMDREGEHMTKTGRIYRAAILNAQLAETLKAVPADSLVVNPRTTDRHRWFERDLVNWCRPFTGASKKPLHRLRGLYADHLAEITEDAVTARLAGIREASKALGHTSTTTTLNHYLSAQ